MTVYLNIAQILISIVLIVLVLLQARGFGMGSVFGSDSSAVYKTRRGVERTIFNMTIVFSVLFLSISLLSVMIH